MNEKAIRRPQAELETEQNKIIARIADLQTEGDVLDRGATR